MGRLLAFLLLIGVGLALLPVVAPLALVAALGILVLAWRRPGTVERVTSHPRMAFIPQPLRSTPMRLAASLVVVALALTATSAAITRRPGEDGSPLAPTGVAEANPSPTEGPTPIKRASLTPRPTPELAPTPEAATLKPTPSPEPTAAPGEAPTGPTSAGLVVNVVDGDTIDVIVDGNQLRVRLIGMDTPEVHSGVEWLGAEASAAMSAMVAGKEVVLEKDVSETDQYGRALRYVWLNEAGDWLFVNLELIRLGFASVTTYPPDVKYVDALYLAAQSEAQAAGLGRWGAGPTPVPTAAAILPLVPPSNCEPSYPDICIPVGAADLDCPDMYAQGISMIRVRYDVPNPDPHRFDGSDNDGLGCEG